MSITLLEMRQRILDFNGEPLERYPGVTKVINGTKDMSGLNAWRDRIGHEEADRIVEESKQIGTSLDKIFNDYLDPTLTDFQLENYQDERSFQLFKQIQPTCDKIEPLVVQHKVFNDRLKYMGYLDCLGFYKGKLTIIDCKNTKKEKPEEYLTDYFFQCSAYALAIGEMYGVVPSQMLLVMARRDSSFPQIVERKVAPYIPEVVKRCNDYYLSKTLEG